MIFYHDSKRKFNVSAGHSAGGREELPRPNAPAHDENYNNRSYVCIILILEMYM